MQIPVVACHGSAPGYACVYYSNWYGGCEAERLVLLEGDS